MKRKVILACSICGSRNYTTSKHASKQPERLKMQKYCKTCHQHTLHRETK
ncbi:50S ribosomal protein L33 [Lentibacillus salicampi]|uniref:Large ribosomal subunit protein bL33 n=1 Tax=Lentibacillus salicampi TaxID=175306 RepID=A0A4Y9AAG4_9BACI|nr:50S ribosomal protein L33 [Lentibacillus salicampi]TFJ92888.1 50S ribosomal protein L33 [Lentibacillus salicampi]